LTFLGQAVEMDFIAARLVNDLVVSDDPDELVAALMIRAGIS